MAEELSTNADATETLASSSFGQVPVEITISVGRARPSIRELLTVGEDAVFPLDRTLDDPVELYIGEKLIARGELEELDQKGEGHLGVRLTEVIGLKGLK